MTISKEKAPVVISAEYGYEIIYLHYFANIFYTNSLQSHWFQLKDNCICFIENFYDFGV